MYIISVDLGSTNYKTIIMKIEKDNISLVGKKRNEITDFELFIEKILEEYNIKISEIEKLLVTGTGSSFLSDNVKGIPIEKINEFDAIGYGGLILSEKEEGLVVSIGTGTAFVYSNMVENIHIGGTGLGGGTFVGLGRKFFRSDEIEKDDTAPNFHKLLEIAKKGNTKNVDLTISDINKGDIEDLTSDITAANFAALQKKSFSEDYIAGIVNMILENIVLLAKLHKKNLIYQNSKLINDLPIIFVGTMVSDLYIQKLITDMSSFTKDKYYFAKYSDFAIAIGSYEYYLLRLRKI